MEQVSRNAGRLAVMAAAALLASCSAFRPMPTHGGGKRFDEEQRLVSGTIQHTLSRVDYSRLKRGKISLEVTAPETSGGLAQAFDWKDAAKVTPTPPRYPGPQTVLQYRVNPWLQNSPVVTNQDIEFLEKSAEANLRSHNFQVVDRTQANLHLVILVDCLGTNQSRNDFALAFRDKLQVTCSITWYAMDARTQEVVVPAQSLISHGSYAELNVRLAPWDKHQRNLGVVTDRNLLMLNPHTAAVAKGARGSAPVSALEPGVPNLPGRKSGGGTPGMRFRDVPPAALPDPNGGSVSPNLLPPLDAPPPIDLPPDVEDPAAGDITKMPVGELIRHAWGRSKAKDVAGLRASIEEIKKRKADAPALEKLNERLGQLEKNSKP